MVLVFFIPYIIFQPLLTAVIRAIGPPAPFVTHLSRGFAFSPNWQTLTGLRALLGLLEAGFFPGSVYLLSCWYSRYDAQKRFSAWYIIGCVASALYGILCFGFSQMNGLQGHSGWMWIFIMQGVVTFVSGIICFIFVVDFPDKGHKAWAFLTEQECAFPFSLSRSFRPALDLKVWGLGMIFFCLTTVTCSIFYFLPVILRENLGFSVAASQCLVAPPYVLAGILMWTTSWAGGKYHIQGPILVLNSIITLIGLPIMGSASNPGVRYFGVFITTAGANANIPASMAYQANNVRGYLVFRSQDAPEYRPGIWAAIACQLLLIVVVALLSVYFWISNRKADRGEKVIEGSPGFRYTL
ncbi:major facilitator superfamily domain-containing protein [Aspergillus carlsbadensis]|nr:major facilitator superfamily domain-containing protein [Aspergillus carlsbadensis]